MCRAKAGPGSPSATTPALRAMAACMSVESRESLSAARASSYRTTNQAGCPSASVTGCTGANWRTAANTGNGLSRSYAPQAASVSAVVISRPREQRYPAAHLVAARRIVANVPPLESDQSDVGFLKAAATTPDATRLFDQDLGGT